LRRVIVMRLHHEVPGPRVRVQWVPCFRWEVKTLR
jgi:hypothetical protein